MKSATSPNVVYLHAHDCGRYIQPYGFPVETPSLMAFAKEGVLFRKAYCASPTCGPSRAAMLTGQYPHQIGMYGLPGRSPWKIDRIEKHWVHHFNNWGYETVLAGVQHEVNHDDISPIGYQKILDTRVKQGEAYPETIDHVERYLGQVPKDRPFFLSIGLDEPHDNNCARPELGIGTECERFSKTRYYDPEKLDWRYTSPPPWLPDIPELRKEMRSFYEGVRIMDDYMGRVLYALKHRGLESNTLVIITSDHGIEFPGGKMTLSDHGTGVLLMMRGPGGFSGGRVIEPMVSHLDLFPTLCALLGREAGHALEGKSLLPLVNGNVTHLHDAVFAEQTHHAQWSDPMRCIRTERYKLVLRLHETGPRMEGSRRPGGRFMATAGFYHRNLGHEELFDLYLDPHEACNRINDPMLQEVRKDLKAKLDDWMRRTGDPFLTGNLPPHV